MTDLNEELQLCGKMLLADERNCKCQCAQNESPLLSAVTSVLFVCICLMHPALVWLSSVALMHVDVFAGGAAL